MRTRWFSDLARISASVRSLSALAFSLKTSPRNVMAGASRFTTPPDGATLGLELRGGGFFAAGLGGGFFAGAREDPERGELDVCASAGACIQIAAETRTRFTARENLND